MLKSALKYLPVLVIAPIILAFVDVHWLFWLLFQPFMFMGEHFPLLPAVLNVSQLYSIYGLWLGGLLYFSALMWVAVTRRNKAYLCVAVALAVFVTGMTLFSIPLGEQNQRRWQSMNQQALPAWERFFLDRDTQFYRITQRQPFDKQAVIESFTEQTAPLTSLPLGWNKDDAAAADALWQQALGKGEQEAQALLKMADYVSWMPDYATLVLASAILTLTTDEDKTHAEAAFRQAISVAPDNPDAWLGWALAQIQSHDNAQARYGRSQPLAQSITTGLLMAESFKDGPRQPALAQRLADYIAQMPQDDRQILSILQARMHTRRCDMPLAEHEKGEADKVLPLRASILDRSFARSIVLVSSRSPGHVVIEAEKYGLDTARLPVMRYPEITRDIRSATTILSLDVRASGEVLDAQVECTSGVVQFDEAAIAYSTQWSFKPAPQGRRVLMPVTFISDRPNPEEYFQEMEARAIRIARLAARHNKAGMQAAVKKMDERYRQMRMFFPEREVDADDWQALQMLSQSKGGMTDQDRLRRFNEKTQQLEKMSAKYPYNVSFLHQLALSKEANSFEEDRARWAKMLVLAPQNPHIWAGWGSVWGEVDPELYLGAVIYSNLLFPDKSYYNVNELQIRVLLKVGMGTSNAMLVARANTDYADMLKYPAMNAREEDAVNARKVFPASTKLSRDEWVFPADPEGKMTVDVNQEDIVHAPLSGVPLLEPAREGNKRTVITVDTDKNGIPTLVLVSKSSLVEEYDAQAVNMVWGWRFSPLPGGRQITVGVNFSR